jgi:phosphoribosylamine--glycine ligase
MSIIQKVRLRMNKVLLIGSGGREHALAWKLAQSPHVAQIYVAPGNGGTAWAAQDDFVASENVPLAIDDFPALIAFAQAQQIALTVVGPEVPLAAGIVDAFQAAGLRIFGPSAAAAQLEASKAFAKDFMTEQGIPTARYVIVEDEAAARQYLREHDTPLVVKADGLAAGKGVIVCDNREEAGMAVHKMFVERAFGDAGATVILEERLNGREVSVLAFCDGHTVKPMRLARDYKRVYDGDQGGNTGGMGAIAPVDDLTPAMLDDITQRVLQPVLTGMAALGTPYVGILYAGLMLTADGYQVLEFNCRFGDPETQVLLPLLKTDLYEIFIACIEGRLDQLTIEWHDGACATVILAAGGYPDQYAKGLPISGLANDALPADVLVFHAGTVGRAGQHFTNGGRVLAVTAQADTLPQALARVYATIPQIHFDGQHYRRDIGR